MTSIIVTNPISGEVVGEVPCHTPADVIAAVQCSQAAQPAWAALPFRQRAKVIKRFHDLSIDQRDSLFDTIQAETGKSRRDAFVELFAVSVEARYYAYHGGQALRPHRARPGLPTRSRSKVVYRPRGVVGVISPWNFPFILTAGDTIPALLAGNGVVIKPASLTPLSALWMRNRLVECGLPADLLQVVTGAGREIGNALIDHVDYVMFTGSTAIGRRVAERAAARLIPYSMELGGKNAMLVLPDANLKHAATGAIDGGFANCGQVCINWERVYVDALVYDTFVEELVRQTQALRLGSGQDFNTDLGSVISEDQVTVIETHVLDAVKKGAHVLVGGLRRPDLGPLFYEPTVLADVTPEMLVHSEETFGPVLSVYKVSSLEEAIRRANDSDYGLNASVWTRNRARGRAVAEELVAGTVNVNDTTLAWASLDAPMGGMKESGLGRRHGVEGIRKYTEPQTIVTNLTNYQIGSFQTALAISKRLADALAFLLKLWRRVPFIR